MLLTKKDTHMRILIIGTGYVGLVTGACFAEMGHHVICLDINEKKIKDLQKGIIPIYEPGLQEIVLRNIEDQRLAFTTDYQEGIKHAQVCFIAVPTPSNDDGSCNISYVQKCAESIGQVMDEYRVIVNKSTVPIKTAQMVKEIISEQLKRRSIDIEFDVVSNPEFLKEGSAISDCMKPDRVIIGYESTQARDIMREVYSPFMLNHDRLIEMDILSAELTKYAANAMLAARISFMNEISQICKRIGANINEIRKGIGSDKRIGNSFLYAGIGYGGSCFPKDVRALIATAKESGYEPALLEAVETINQKQKKELLKSMLKYYADKGGLSGKTIAIWGLAFKPDTDDMREAPSLVLIEELLKAGANVRLYDPVSMNNAKNLLKEKPQITWCKSEFEAAQSADAIALLTEWKQFRLVSFPSLVNQMQGSAFFDGRNQYKSSEMKKHGFDYFCIGVKDIVQ